VRKFKVVVEEALKHLALMSFS
jgi:hypothetical protein